MELVERASELHVLRDEFEIVTSGHSKLVLVEGVAGVGKTALVEEFVAGVRASGEAVVLQARADATEIGFRFGVVRQLFEPAVARWTEEQAVPMFAGPAMPATHVLSTVPCMGPSVDVVEEKRRVLHGLYWLVLRMSADQPLVIVVDDVDLADPISLEWLHYAVRKVSSARVLLVFTTSDSVAGDPWPVPATTVRLGPLSAEGVRSLMPGAAGEIVDAVCRITAGNPFLVRGLTVQPALGETVEGIAAAPAFAALVKRWLARSSYPFAAALGVALDPVVAVRIAGLDAPAAAQAEAELRQLGLLTGNPSQWRHEALRAAVVAGLSTQERRDLHQAVARVLRDNGAAPEAVAAHLLHAGTSDHPWTTRTLITAAQDAMRSGAADRAVTYLRRALEEPHEQAEVRLHLGLAEAHSDPDAAAPHLIEVIGDLQGSLHTQAAEALTDALLRSGRGTGPLIPAEQHLGALKLGMLVSTGQYPAKPPARGTAGSVALATAYSGGTAEQSAELARQELGAPTMFAHHAVVALALGGHGGEALHHGERHLGATVDGPFLAKAGLADARVVLALLGGDPLRAEELLADVPEDGWGHLAAAPLATRLAVLNARGAWSRVLELTADGLEMSGDRLWDAIRFQRAIALYRLGWLEQARVELDAVELDHPVGLPREATAAVICAALGDRTTALAHAQRAVASADRWGADRARGIALRALGVATGGARGQELLLESAGLLAARADRLELAETQLLLGQAYLEHSRAQAARKAFTAACELAELSGAAGVAQVARERLQTAGARPRRAAASGMESLTASELRIAELATAGESNKSIADELRLTLRTVETHLSAVYRKLGITGRAGLRVLMTTRSEA